MDDSSLTPYIDIVKFVFEGVEFQVIIDKQKVSAENITYDTRNSHPLFEVHFIAHGENVMEIEGNILLLKKDDFCIIKPGKFHAHIRHGGNIAEMFPIRFNFRKIKGNSGIETSQYIKEFIEMLQDKTSYITGNSTDIIRIPESIAEEKTCRRAFFLKRIELLVMELFILMIRSIKAFNINDAEEQNGVPECKRSYMIDTFFSYNYHTKGLADTDLALLLNISRRQLNRVLQKLYGCPFSKNLLKVRLEKSKLLLFSTGLPIEIIMDKCGFSNTEYFYRTFKQHTGMTPGQYRLSQT